MTILHVLYSNRFSGAENVVCQIIEMFREYPDVRMVYCSPDSDIVRHALCHPVMSADRFQPPDLVLVVECNAVGFIGSVLLQKRRKPENAFARGADIRQHEDDDILFADAARNVLFPLRLCLLIFHERIRRKHARIGGDRLMTAGFRFITTGR